MAGTPDIPGFEILERLGAGSDATVWRARSADGLMVALKVIPLARLRDPDRHLRDVWAAGATGCRQVMAIHDTGRTAEVAWLAMEPASGDLAALVKASGGRLPIGEALRLCRDAARGLQALADHGFIHRDVKPGNILLRADGSAMIGDLAPARGGGTATRSADIGGTPAFMSPEQAQGLPPDPRCDVYGLGATLFALVAGRPPFQGDSAVELLRAIVETPAPPLRSLVPDAPADLTAVLSTALAKDPACRHARPGLLADDLDALLAGRVPASAAASALRPAVAPQAAPARHAAGRRSLAILAAAGTAACALGLVLGILAGRPEPGRDERERQEVERRLRERQRDQLSVRQRELADEITALRSRFATAQAELARREAARNVQPAVETAAVTPMPVVAAVVAPAPPVAAAAPPPVPAAPANVAPATVPATEAVGPWPLPATAILPDPAAIPGRVRSATLPGSGSLTGVWMNPDLPEQILAWSSFSELLHSGDGGQTWAVIDSPPSGSRSARSMHRRAVQAGSRVFIGSSGKDCLGWMSIVDGRTFVRITPPPETADSTDDAGLRCMLADGSLVCGRPFRTAEQSGLRLLTSRDLGRTWSETGRSTERISHLLPCGLRSGLACTGSDGWRLSLDGGATWGGPATRRFRGQLWQRTGDLLALCEPGNGVALLDLVTGAWSIRTCASGTQRDLTAFALDPRDARRIYATDRSDGLLRSRDGGATWERFRRITGGAFALDLVGRERPRLAVAYDSTVAVLDLGSDDDALFLPVPAPAPGVLQMVAADGGGLLSGLGVNPADPGDLAIWGYQTLLRSRDGGASWQSSPLPKLGTISFPSRMWWAPKQKAFLFGGSGGSGYDGCFYSGDDGATFSVLAAPWWGLKGGARQALPWAMLDNGTLVGAWAPEDSFADGGKHVHLLGSRNGGKTWQEEQRLADHGLLAAPLSGGLLLAGCSDGRLVVSVDGGRTLAPAKPIVRISRLTPWWHAQGSRVWLVDDAWTTLACYDHANRTWTSRPLSGLAPSGRLVCSAFAIDPSDSQRMWVVGRACGLLHSQDGGASWRTLDVPLRIAAADGLEMVRSVPPRLAVLCADGLALLDAGAAGSALFSTPFSPTP